MENGPKNVQIAIVGNKEDLVEREAVDQGAAKDFAAQIGAVFKKTSAKTSFGIESLFIELAQKINPKAGGNRAPGTAVTPKQTRAKKVKRKCC